MFRLAELASKVAQWPYVPMLQEDNARKGFFEAAEFQAVLADLAEASGRSPKWRTSRLAHQVGAAHSSVVARGLPSRVDPSRSW
jgi:hypothetical protein